MAGFYFLNQFANQVEIFMNTAAVSFNCLLKSKNGDFIRSLPSHDVVSTGGNDRPMLMGLAKALENLIPGQKCQVTLTPSEAYGSYDPEKKILYPLEKLGRGAKTGKVVTITSKSGVSRTYTVGEIHGTMASLDGNHPLAGQELLFEIEELKA
jgi:FKBP-type peptidyl-prolyl cis-trans isomerase SlyD